MPHLVLVVDDAKAVREIAKAALRPLGLEVAEATNGYNALFAMEKARPDVLVLDVKMPIMDGLELLTMMRSTAELKDLPVVMLTSPADHAILAKLTELGASALLRKPFKDADLVAAVQTALGSAD